MRLSEILEEHETQLAKLNKKHNRIAEVLIGFVIGIIILIAIIEGH